MQEPDASQPGSAPGEEASTADVAGATTQESGVPEPSGAESTTEEMGTITGTGGDSVNCRDSASTNSNVIVTLPEGATVPLNGQATNGWQPAVCAGRPGYVAAEFITITEPETTAPPVRNSTRDVMYVAGATTCYAAPVASSWPVATLQSGAQVESIGAPIENWQPVRCEGRYGFVHLDNLTTEPAPAGDAGAPVAASVGQPRSSGTLDAPETGSEPEPVMIQPSDGSTTVDSPGSDAFEDASSSKPNEPGSADSPALPPGQVLAGEQPSTDTPEVPTGADDSRSSPLTVVNVNDSEHSAAAADAVDSDPATSWSVVPQISSRQVDLTLDLGQPQSLGRLELMLAGNAALPLAEIWLSMDGATWWNVASFDSALAMPAPDGTYTVPLGYTARFVRLVLPNVDSPGIPEVGGIAEVTVWPADGETRAPETLGVPVTPIPEPNEAQAAPVGATEPPSGGDIQGTETPMTEGQIAPVGDEFVPEGESGDPPQVIEAEPAG